MLQCSSWTSNVAKIAPQFPQFKMYGKLKSSCSRSRFCAIILKQLMLWLSVFSPQVCGGCAASTSVARTEGHAGCREAMSVEPERLEFIMYRVRQSNGIRYCFYYVFYIYYYYY